MSQLSLFSDPAPAPRPNWRPSEFPNLSAARDIILDFETTGLRWWAGDQPVGLGIGTLDGASWYLPYRHAGGNLDEANVFRWAQSELRGKNIIAANARFDAHMAYVDDLDLEALGCTITDVQHYAALLDDHRREFSLEKLGQYYLGEGKVQGLDKTRMASYHAADVEDYARQDIVLTGRLRNALWPLLDKQNLQRVRQLEDDCIFPTCEMERNGAPLDEEKLEQWVKRSELDFIACCWDLYRETGLRITPTKAADVRKLFAKYGLPIPINTFPGPDQGKETFGDIYLAAIPHPAVQLLRRARKLASLRSKFLVPYLRDVRAFGVLRYSLNQLRTDDGGTVSGRYSSSRLADDEGVNIQQVAGKKHAAGARSADGGAEDEHSLESYVIRSLFIPRSGLWLSSDAEQIEYRLFAHYARPPAVLAAYAKDPYTDFHNAVMEMIIRTTAHPISRERTKDVNFAKIYGAGLRKIALMLRLPESTTKALVNAYDRAFPEARRLLRKASDLAESRGYVETILGRRARFPQKYQLHAALNRVIQGTAADINKQKLVELFRARKQTGLVMRFTVHDEVNGDVLDLESARLCDKILNEQSFDTGVPILWKTKTGPNWSEGKKVA